MVDSFCSVSSLISCCRARMACHTFRSAWSRYLTMPTCSGVGGTTIGMRFMPTTESSHWPIRTPSDAWACLLYTSDAADDLLCVDLGGRRIIKKKNYYYCNI